MVPFWLKNMNFYFIWVHVETNVFCDLIQAKQQRLLILLQDLWFLKIYSLKKFIFPLIWIDIFTITTSNQSNKEGNGGNVTKKKTWKHFCTKKIKASFKAQDFIEASQKFSNILIKWNYLAVPDFFAKIVKVINHTGLWDAKLAWYSLIKCYLLFIKFLQPKWNFFKQLFTVLWSTSPSLFILG